MTKVYRLITDLMDIATFPALLLAQEYHQRWEAENTLDELKVHLNGRKTPIRSRYSLPQGGSLTCRFIHIVDTSNS